MARRFIAGAVCPECQQMDKIVTYQQDGEDVAECVFFLAHKASYVTGEVLNISGGMVR